MAARKKKSAAKKSAAKKKGAARKKVAKKATKAASRRPAAKTNASPIRRQIAPPPLVPLSPALRDLDQRIGIVRANLRELVDQAASSAGAASEELLSQRIAEQEERLRRLVQERDQLSQ